MAQKDKTKEEFIEEIKLLQKRIAEFEKLDSERKKAEDALRESEEKYRFLFESIPLSISITTLDGRALLANHDLEILTGYSVEEFIAFKDVSEMYVDREQRKQLIDLLRKEGKVRNFETKLKRKDGAVYHALMNVDFIELHDEQVALTIVRDITEQKKMQEDLKKEFSNRQTLIDNLPCIAMILKKGTREIIFSNESAKKVGAFPGKTCYETCALREDSCPWCLAPEVWATNESRRLEVEYRGVYYEGIWVPYNEDSYVHYIFDITERKKMEEEILALSKFPSENPSPVLRIAKEGEILYSNKAGLELLAHWDVKIGEKAPEKWRCLIKEMLESVKSGLQEEEVKGKIFLVTISPVIEAGYINLYAYDITERKQAEEEIRNKENLLRNIINSTPDFIFVKDTKLRTVLCNKSFASAMGKTIEELIGHTDIENGWDPELVHGNPAKGIRGFENDDRDALSGKTIHNPYDPANSLNGMLIFDTYKMPLYGKNDEIIGMLGIARDITERKKTEEALRENEERLRDIMFSMGDWVWEVDEKGAYTYSSHKGSDLFGQSSEDIIGKTPFDFMPQDEAKRVAAIFSEIVANKAPIKDMENWNIKKNGERICLLTNGVPILDEKGNFKGYRGVDKDITERKQVEYKLKENERFLDTIIENIPDMIFVKDAKELKFLRFNKAGENLLGYSKDELYGKSDRDFFPKDEADFFIEKDREVLNNKQVADIPEERIKTRHKGERILHTKKIPLMDDRENPLYLLGISEDITERKKIGEETQKHLRELEIFYKASIGREERIIELKKEVERLKKELEK